MDSNTTSNDCNAAFYVKPSSEDDITIEMGPPSTSMPDGTKVPHSPGSRTTDPVSSEESPSGESSSSASSDGFQPRIYFVSYKIEQFCIIACCVFTLAKSYLVNMISAFSIWPMFSKVSIISPTKSSLGQPSCFLK